MFEHLEGLVEHIASHPDGGDVRRRLETMVHSFLCMLDGVTGLPAFEVLSRPHPDDKAFRRSEGERWWPDGMNMHALRGTMVMLHEQWGRRRRGSR